jgi:GNAT superfamily N-acetyltransferase
MKVTVRPARYESDEQELTDVLQANLPYRPHARFFSWLYRGNPDGEALAWVATDPEGRRIVGAAAAFPRRLYCNGREARGYVLGDFCINPEYRSLGLALALQRACLEGLSQPPGFVFDFPSYAMLAIYKRLRIEVNVTMIRHAKPLRADRKMAEHVPVRAVASGLSIVLNAGLRLRDKRRRLGADWTTAAEGGPWGEEFTQAGQKWSTGICVLRTAQYLNWRYRGHPLQSYEMLTARQGGELRGYLIFHRNGDECTIDDLLAEDDRVLSVLLAEATAVARQREVHTLSVSWLSTHPGRQLLEQNRFWPRESSPVVLLALPQPAQGGLGPVVDQWYLTSGDCDA